MKTENERYTPRLKYETFEEAFAEFVRRHSTPATMTWDPHEPPYAASEIRVVFNALGAGYIHMIGQDSETIDFKKLYKAE